MKSLLVLFLLFSQTVLAKSPDQVYVMPHTGNIPSFGQVDLSQSAAVKNALGLTNGGTGATSAADALDALLPSQSGQSGNFLTTNGTTPSWEAVPTTSPGGSNSSVQVNQSGAFGSYSGFTASSTAVNVPALQVGTGAPLDPLSISAAVPASATDALVNLSNTALSGASASGTLLGANLASYGPDWINFQAGGQSAFTVSEYGDLYAEGGLSTGSYFDVTGSTMYLGGWTGGANSKIVNAGDGTGAGTIQLGQSGEKVNIAGGLQSSGSASDGQLLIGGTSDGTFTPATITAGAGVSVTNGAHSITVAMADPIPSPTSSGDVLTDNGAGAYVEAAPSGGGGAAPMYVGRIAVYSGCASWTADSGGAGYQVFAASSGCSYTVTNHNSGTFTLAAPATNIPGFVLSGPAGAYEIKTNVEANPSSTGGTTYLTWSNSSLIDSVTWGAATTVSGSATVSVGTFDTTMIYASALSSEPFQMLTATTASGSVSMIAANARTSWSVDVYYFP